MKKILILGTVFTLIMSSCNKKDDINASSSENVTVNETEQNLRVDENVFEQDVENVCRHHRDPDFFMAEIKELDTTDNFPKLFVLDYGQGTEKNGKVLKGKIIVELSAPHDALNTTRIVTFESFIVDDREMNGIRKMTFIGSNEQGYPTVEIHDKMNIKNESGSVQRTMDGNVSFIAGFETIEKQDDHVLISGTGSMTMPDGKTMVKEIIKPIERKPECKHPVSGIEERDTPKGKVQIDFGDGTCDNLAMITRDGKSEEVNLDEMKRPRRRK